MVPTALDFEWPRRLLLSALATIAVAAPAFAQGSGTGRVTGIVTDSAGTPLGGVTMTLGGAADRVGRTDRRGGFEFTELSDGDYTLAAVISRFAPATRTFRLARGETITLSLTLSLQFTEETLVTGGKTGERDVNATPMAMSLVGARELERLQVDNVEEAARLVPAVTFSQNTGFAQLTVRGIGTNAVFAGSDPSSAVYLDGVYLARPAMALADFLDVERLEVLRGPQGTLYGRNAVGGAVNVITRMPTGDFRATARVVAGTFDRLRGQASVSGPIVGQRLLGSVAVMRGTARGFVRDLDHQAFLGGDDVTAVAGKLQAVLTGRSDLVWLADVTHLDPTPLTYAKVLAVKPGFQVDNPAGLHNVRASATGRSRNLQYGSALRFSSAFAPGMTLTSLTAYRQTDYDVLVDLDITELDLTISHQHEIHDQWSEELTVAHQRPGLSWIAGMFVFDDRDRQASRIELHGAGLENHLHPVVDTDSRALFGETTVALTSRLSATAGLRYTRERKVIRNEGQLVTLASPQALVAGSAFAYTDALRHHAWTPRVAFDIRADDHLLLYMSATRGFKSGGFNPTAPGVTGGFAPEWAWSYEGGFKTTIAGGRSRVNVAAFYTDYSNLQVQIAIRPGVIDISNAAVATIKGLEIEQVADVSGSLRLGGYVSWLDARYDRYVAVGVGGVTGDVAGRRLNNAPEWTARGWLDWQFGTSGGGTWSVRPDVVWQTTAFFTPFNDTIQRQPSYAVLNLSVEWQPRHRYSVIAYVGNLVNRDYITGTFSSPLPAIGGRPGPPRQAGVEFAVRR